MQRETSLELFNLTLRGFLAEAFRESGEEPNAAEWEILRGTREISMREISDILHRLGRPEPQITFRNTGAAS